MTASYNTITGSTGPVTIPARTAIVSGGGCATGPVTWPAVTVSAPANGGVAEYEPVLTSQVKLSPTSSEKRNFEKMKRDGVISMTPYNVAKTTVREFVVSRPFVNVGWKRESSYCPTSPPVCLVDSGPIKAVTSWVQNDHIGSLPLGTPFSQVSVDGEYGEEIRDAVSSTQQAAYADALATYDFLTELAERGETLRYLQSRIESAAKSLREFAESDQSTHERARSTSAKELLRSANKAFRRYGSKWMEYRYAIMPIVYSIKDIRDLLKQRESVFKTGRSKQLIQIDLESKGLSDFQIYQTAKGSISVSSTFKTSYDYGALQRLVQQVRFNPFTTAWELIPFSFVIDWFANIGEAIAASTTIDVSSQGLGCTAVKRIIDTESYLFDFRDLSFRKTLLGGPCGNLDVVHNQRMSCDDLLKKESLESYERTVYRYPQFDVVVGADLNWKRIVDGLVLSHQPIQKLLRNL